MSTLSISPHETAQFLREEGFKAPGKIESLLLNKPILVVLHGNARTLHSRSKHPYEPALARIENPYSMMEHSDNLCYYLDFIEPFAYFAIPEGTKPRTILYLGGGNSGKLRTSHRVMLPYCFTGDRRKMDELFPMNELYKSTRELQSPTPL